MPLAPDDTFVADDSVLPPSGRLVVPLYDTPRCRRTPHQPPTCRDRDVFYDGRESLLTVWRL